MRAETSYAYEHATPLCPAKGQRRRRLDALRKGQHLISASAWLRLKKAKGKK